ncbi:MAG: right-handed parallel beta-helix repeat-containing protein [Gammaproteobacteria bacterium]
MPRVIRAAMAGVIVMMGFGGIDTACAADSTIPGRVSVPYPTTNGIAIEWAITGDDDRDGEVGVRYRRVGAAVWSDAMPLQRVPAATNAGFIWRNKHSGSVFRLAPDTLYEIELTLDDPDNTMDSAIRTAVRTRAEPGGRADRPATKRATPASLRSILAAALPGDIIELAAGRYAGFIMGVDGTDSAPIVVRGSSRGGVVVDGRVSLNKRRYVRLARMTVNGTVTAHGADSFAITGLIVNTAASGIVFRGCSRRGFVADNRVIGATRWVEAALGVHGDSIGEGIQFNGPGHVVRNNLVQGFQDDISFMEGGAAACEQYSIDVMYNEIGRAGDDGVEADYCRHNCRILWNRFTNVFIAMSAQPSLGGPTYFIGNAVYNSIQGPFKLHNGSRGDVILYNTVVKNGDALAVYATAPYSGQVLLNNIFIGGPGGRYNGWANGTGRVVYLPALAGARIDYNSFGSMSRQYSGQIGAAPFAGLAQLGSIAGRDNAFPVDLRIFANPIQYPHRPLTEYPPQDLRIRRDAPVADTALCRPNIRRCDIGSGPDRGAYEAGAALPVYGPRY